MQSNLVGTDRKSIVDRWLGWATEAVTLTMACLAPWAFGSVDAWAEFGLDLGVVMLAILGAASCWRPARGSRPACVPSLVLAGLAALALVQSVPLPSAALRWIAPGAFAFRCSLVPRVAERVVGDPGLPVALPAATLSLNPEASLHAAMQLAASWILFRSVLNLGRGTAPLRRFGLAVTVNATLLALFALLQAMSWGGKIYGIRPTAIQNGWLTGGPFVCHNHLAAYLNLGLGLALGLLLAAIREEGSAWGTRRPGGRGVHLWAAFAVGLIVVGILGSHSRCGSLGMVVATAAMALILRLKTVRLSARFVAALLLVPVFLIALGSSSPFQRLATILDPLSTSLRIRLLVWEAGLRAWRIDPIWGTGLGSFAAVTTQFYPVDDGNFYSHAENEYLHVLIEGGCVGFGLALWGLAAMARLTWRALAAARPRRDLALILGALFGGLALLVQNLSDFALHIPGVAIAAVILGAHLCRLGLAARAPAPIEVPRSPWAARVGRGLVGLAAVGLGLILAVGAFKLARSETYVVGAGLPAPDAMMPTAGRRDLNRPALEQIRAGLVRALRDRPDWTEGYLRLGLAYLDLYQDAATEQVAAAGGVPEQKDLLADPLWLRTAVHAAPASRPPAAGELLAHEPIRRYLVPAARCFLEARRCCPVAALAHAELASLDFLLERGEPTTAYACRAARLAGPDSRILAHIARVAVQDGDLGLAAGCWRRMLEVRGAAWEEVADAAGAVLSPERVLDQVLPPGGRFEVVFSDYLYAEPEARPARERFLKAALERLPRNAELPEDERLWIEAQARARLGDRERAAALMGTALAREPQRSEWRLEYVNWLLNWGDFDRAHRQARIGVQFAPGHGHLRHALKVAVEALARGAAGPQAGVPYRESGK
jgi:O-antigen ligase/tetratricopeptide (TPR) repeat protein